MSAAETKQARSVVTGGAGFIGSHLVEGLLGRGHEVLVVDNLSTGHERNLEQARGRGATLATGDVTDPEFLDRELAAFEPTAVFHLAAQVDVRKAVADPGSDALANVVGTANVLEAAHRAGATSCLLASTGGAIYGEGEGQSLPFTEQSPAVPLTPYGTSKLAAEAYIGLYRRLYGMAGISLRLGNVYGPRQDPHGEAGVVAIFCGKLRDGERPTIFGDGDQTRDYVYVGDVVEAFLAAHDAIAGGSYSGTGLCNVGTGRETSVIELLEQLAAIGGKAAEHEPAPHRFGEVQRVVIDPGLAGVELGWQPRVEIEAGLRKTFESFATTV